VGQLYLQALGTHFSRLLRHAWATVGLYRSLMAKVADNVVIFFTFKARNRMFIYEKGRVLANLVMKCGIGIWHYCVMSAT
jgi:hypothetical protein